MNVLKDLLAIKNQIVEADDDHEDELRNDLDLRELIEKWMDQERIYSLEGPRGVRNFSNLVRVLGYHSFDEFLEDNPGALEALVNWITDSDLPEWKEKFSAVVEESIAAPVKQGLDEAANPDEKLNAILDKIARSTSGNKRDVRALFVGGSSPGMRSYLEKLVKDGYDDGGGWIENQAWFKKHGVTKSEYNALVKASL